MKAWDEITVRAGQIVKVRDERGRLVGVVADLDGSVRFLVDRAGDPTARAVDPALLAQLEQASRRLGDLARRRTAPPAPSAQLELQEIDEQPAPAKGSTVFRLRELTAQDVAQIYTAVSRATAMGNALTALEMEGPFVSLDYRRRNQALLLLAQQGRTHLCYTALQGPRHYYRTGTASSCSAPDHAQDGRKRRRKRR